MVLGARASTCLYLEITVQPRTPSELVQSVGQDTQRAGSEYSVTLGADWDKQGRQHVSLSLSVLQGSWLEPRWTPYTPALPQRGSTLLTVLFTGQVREQPRQRGADHWGSRQP